MWKLNPTVVKSIYTVIECVLCLADWFFLTFLFCNITQNLVPKSFTFYIVKMRRPLLSFHICTQLANINLHTQILTTVTLVSKYPHFNVTSLVKNSRLVTIPNC